MKKSTVSFGFYEREKGGKKKEKKKAILCITLMNYNKKNGKKWKGEKCLPLLDATKDQVSKKIHVPAWAPT